MSFMIGCHCLRSRNLLARCLGHREFKRFREEDFLVAWSYPAKHALDD